MENESDKRMRALIYKMVEDREIPNIFLSLPEYCVALFRAYLNEVIEDVFSEVEDADEVVVCGEELIN